MPRLQGKTAIVTGAAKGIGLAIAKCLVGENARVLLSDIDRAGVETAAAELGQPAICVDVSKRSEVERMVEFATEQLGQVDILVNNAGVYRNTPLLEMDESEFDQVLAVNLKAVLFGIQAVAPPMIARGSGAIVNIASVAATLGSRGAAAYGVSKAGVVQLTNIAAIELAPYGIRVNAVAPGTFETEMAKGAYADPTLQSRILPRTPLGRLGRPEEVAGVVLFLATDDSSYITGKTIYADGGRMGLNLTV